MRIFGKLRRRNKKHSETLLADQALNKLLRDCGFETVLDIGCGTGKQSDLFRAASKRVTMIDRRPQIADVIAADYVQYEFHQPFDCIWASHVLEHQVDVNCFLKKIFRDLKPGGWLAITVPPAKHEIVGGHLTLWNAGLLLYNLILAGFDCRRAAVKQYDYNISVITPKIAANVSLDELRFGAGDIERLAPLFPQSTSIDWVQGVSGNILELNWDSSFTETAEAA